MPRLSDALAAVKSLEEFKAMLKESLLPAGAGFLGAGAVHYAFDNLWVETDGDYKGETRVNPAEGQSGLQRRFFDAPWKRGLLEAALAVGGGALLWGTSSDACKGLFGAMGAMLSREAVTWLEQEMAEESAGAGANKPGEGLRRLRGTYIREEPALLNSQLGDQVGRRLGLTVTEEPAGLAAVMAGSIAS